MGPTIQVGDEELGRRPIPGLSTPGRVDSIVYALFLKEAAGKRSLQQNPASKGAGRIGVEWWGLSGL